MFKFGYRRGPDAITSRRAFDFQAVVRYVQRTTFVKVFVGLYALLILFGLFGIAFLPEALSALLSVGVFAMILNLVHMVYHFYLWGLAVGPRNLDFKNWAIVEAVIIFGGIFMGLVPFVIPFIGLVLWIVANGFVFSNKANLKDLIIVAAISIVVSGIIALLTTGAFVFKIGELGIQSLLGI